MKSFVKLGVIFFIFGFAIFGHAEMRAEDWKLLKKTEDAKFYYDKKDVTHLSKSIVKVWIKQVYTEKGVADMVNLIGPRYENLSYSINSLEFDCGEKLMRFLSMTYYSKNEDVMDLENPPDKWESIPVDSMFGVLFKKACK